MSELKAMRFSELWEELDSQMYLKSIVFEMYCEIWDGPSKKDEIGINRKIERIRKDLYNDVIGRVHSLESKVSRNSYKSARIARMLGRRELNRQLKRNAYEAIRG